MNTDTPRVLARHGDWIFFYKPPHMHNSIGKNSPCLEAFLPSLAPECTGLCNRLDYETSGIVVGATSPAGFEIWRTYEDTQLCEKRYIMLVCGHMRGPLTQKFALNTTKRTTSKVLRTLAPALRHTYFMPLGQCTTDDIAPLLCTSQIPKMDALPITLVGCRIYKGARHQIRTHAAHAGHALWGDTRYKTCGGNDFFLHHGALRMPAVNSVCPCPWLSALPQFLRTAAEQWLLM